MEKKFTNITVPIFEEPRSRRSQNWKCNYKQTYSRRRIMIQDVITMIVQVNENNYMNY